MISKRFSYLAVLEINRDKQTTECGLAEWKIKNQIKWIRVFLEREMKNVLFPRAVCKIALVNLKLLPVKVHKNPDLNVFIWPQESADRA